MLGYFFNRSLAKQQKKHLAKLAYESDAKIPSTYSGTTLPKLSFVNEADTIAYNLTKGMLDYLNRMSDYTGLCFNELPETELLINRSDMPAFGRRFEFYFKALPLGYIEFSAGWHLQKNYGRPGKGENLPHINQMDKLLRMDYEFLNLEILDIRRAKSTIGELIFLMLPVDDMVKSRKKANVISQEILLDYLWSIQNEIELIDDGRRPIASASGYVEGNAGIYLDDTEFRQVT